MPSCFLMADITLPQQPVPRLNLSRLRQVLFRPRRAFQELSAEARSTWLTPMLVLTITAVLTVIVAGYLKAHAATMGETPLPPDWQYWTPEMQKNYMQAQQATQGPVFLYI